MDEYLETLLSADQNFFPLTRPTPLQATQSIPNCSTQFATTICPNVNARSTPPKMNAKITLNRNYEKQIFSSFRLRE